MEAKEIRKRSLRAFFIIYASSNMFFTVFAWFLLDSRTEGIFYRDTVVLLIISILTSQLHWIFYSKEDLPHRQFVIRHIVHFFAVQGTTLAGINLVLRSMRLAMGITPFRMAIASVVAVSVTYAIIVFVDSYDNRKLASDINKKLKERYGHQ